jgi:hypothetical protein
MFPLPTLAAIWDLSQYLQLKEAVWRAENSACKTFYSFDSEYFREKSYVLLIKVV